MHLNTMINFLTFYILAELIINLPPKVMIETFSTLNESKQTHLNGYLRKKCGIYDAPLHIEGPLALGLGLTLGLLWGIL